MTRAIHPALRRSLWVLALVLSAGVAAPDPETPPAAPAPAATTPAPRPRPRLSSGLRNQVVSVVPAYSPPAPDANNKPKDPDVVELPRVTVREPRLPALDDDAMLTPKGLEEKRINQNLPAFDREFLSRYTLPLFGVSNATRAKFMEEDEKRLRDLDETKRLIEVLEQVDPAQAKELRSIRNRMLVREPVGPTTPSLDRRLR